VAADTAERSAYLTELYFSGAINQYAFDLADRKRKEWNAFGSPEAFHARYTVGAVQMAELAKEAAKLGVKEDVRGMARSNRLIAERLKAGIARNIWKEAGYYRVVIASDSIYLAARRALVSPAP
jgi:carboxyl-terminal processing protease